MTRFLIILFALIQTVSAGEWQVKVDPEKVVRKVELANLLGSNAGLWYKTGQVEALVNSENLKSWGPGLIRIPGGSWSDEIYWNGNGVRTGKNKFDQSKFEDGFWKVDYSKYSPGFRVKNGGVLSKFHGNIDVKAAHEFVQQCGAAALVTVNAGSGTPEMAAEWVKWTKQQGYDVRYWEVGNEMEGEWEVGHRLPDGSKMTGEIYARRYADIARAIKAVDPDAKVGGPAASNDQIVFGDALLEHAGNLVDFISYHTYPVKGGETNPEKIFARTDSILNGVKKVRDQIRAKAPDRADQIEIGITEWHVAVHEGPNTVNEISGPWTAKWIGRMIEAGVDFANIWDFFSQTPEGGHGVFGRDEAMTPRGAYRALEMWGSKMGDTLVKCDVSKGNGLSAFATRNADGKLALLVINESANEPANLQLTIGNREVSGKIQTLELSTANYLWDQQRQRPVWSKPLIGRVAASDANGNYTVPPMSATVFEYESELKAVDQTTVDPVPGFIGPNEQAEDIPCSGLLTLTDPASKDPYTGPAMKVNISTTGPLKLVGEKQVTVHRAAKRINIIPTDSGQGTITFTTASGKTTSHSVKLLSVEMKPKVLWTFGEPSALNGINSSFQISHTTDDKTQKGVAKVDITQLNPDAKGDKNRLMQIKGLPEFEKKDTGGVTFKLRASEDFNPGAKGAKVAIIVQSKANHWMQLGTVDLSKVTNKWQPFSVRVTNPKWFPAMSDLYSVILLYKPDAAAKGSLYLDDLGFLIRN